MAKNYNPNKNVHHKKKNSNYHGYSAQRTTESAKTDSQQKKPRQPLWVSLVMLGIFIILIVVLVMMNGSMKENAVFAQGATLAIGLCCATLVFLQHFSKEPPKGFQKGLSIVLAVMGVVYSFMGAYGLIKLL